MKILRLGKNGMVRSQRGTWYNANHFLKFFLLHETGTQWEICGETINDDFIGLGVFETFEEAEAELDSLFTNEER